MRKKLTDFISFPINNALTLAPLVFDKYLSPEQLFSIFSQQPWAMFLDSCNSQHADSNVDIMVWKPLFTLETYTEKSILTNTENNSTLTLSEDPLTILKQVNNILFTCHNDANIPFKGGAVGLFGYDLGRRFEKIKRQAKQDIKMADMAIGFYDKAIIFNRTTKTFSLLCQSQQREYLQKNITQSLIKNHKQAANFALLSPWQANMSKTEYKQKFAQIQSYLLNGDCYQINLAQRFQATYTGCEYQAYLMLRENNQAPFSAFIRLEKNTVMSLSPERFIQLKGDKVQTKPIKGTRPRHIDPQTDNRNKTHLENATKDRAENLMIVDLLRNDLSRTCVAGSVNVPKLFAIESFPAVHHLVSTIEGTLSEEYDATDLLRGSFPGGSITGAPKIRAMQIIEELEPHRRNVYCGSIGYISACGNMDTSITIRTLVSENNVLYCWAGGGLVADSTVESEYQETFDKVEKILPVLVKAPNGSLV